MSLHPVLTPEARSLARLDAMLTVPVRQHTRLPSSTYACDALVDLRGASNAWLFSGLRPWVDSELLVYEHVSRRFSEGEANKMIAKAVIARAGRAGTRRGWPALKMSATVSLLVVCERPDRGTLEALDQWCDPVQEGIWHKAHGTLVKVTVVALNKLPVSPETLGLHLLGEIRSRSKLSRLAEGLREIEGLDRIQHDQVMEYLLSVEAEMNSHARRPMTPLLDAASARGARNALLATARKLGAPESLVSRAESLPHDQAVAVLNAWLDDFAQQSGPRPAPN